jgi:hypothetical protein
MGHRVGQTGASRGFLTVLRVGYGKLGENEVMVDLRVLLAGARGGVQGVFSRLQGRPVRVKIRF